MNNSIKNTIRFGMITTAAILGSFIFMNNVHAADRGNIEQSNIEEVLSSMVREQQVKKRVVLENGYYEVHGINNSNFNGYELLVDNAENNTDKILAVLVPKRVRKGSESGFGYFYEGRSVKKGSSMMLAPINITNNGNLVVDSEMDTRSPVLLVSKGSMGKFNYEFVVQGKNGALDGAMLGLVRRGDKKKHPKLRATSKKGYFASGSHRYGPELVVVGTELSIYKNGSAEKSYEMVQLNGDDMFSALVVSEFDTMAEYDVSYEGVNKIAMFFDTYSGKEESVIIATPTHDVGRYRMTAYDSGTLGWIKKLFINLFD